MAKATADERRYERYIKSLPCCHCHSQDCSTWHHAIDYGNGVMGGKAHWMMTMPMCWKCHDELHHEIRHGVDGAVKAQLKYIEATLKRAIADGVVVIK